MKYKSLTTLILALLLVATPTLMLNQISSTKAIPPEDVTPPVLNDVWISPSMAYLGEGVTVYVNATDDSGIFAIQGRLRNPSCTDSILFYAERNYSTGLWESLHLVIPDSAELGVWTIQYLRVEDNERNYAFYRHNDDFVVELTVTSIASDVTPPVLVDVWVDPSSFVAGEFSTFFANITDDLSGVDSVEIYVYSPSDVFVASGFLSFNATSGLWYAVSHPPADVELGVWTIKYVTCTDVALNQLNYTYGVDYVADFTITAPVVDVTAPVLNEIYVSPSTVVAGSGFDVYANVTDDLSGVTFVQIFIHDPNDNYISTSPLQFEASSGLWHASLYLSSDAELGLWTIKSIVCTDVDLNRKEYTYGVDYVADFTVTSGSVPVFDVWSSDALGSPKNSFVAGMPVFAAVPESGAAVSLYVVSADSALNDGNSLTDVSLDGVETLTLNSGPGTQTIQVWSPPTVIGNYYLVLDTNNNGVYDAETDDFDSFEIVSLSTIPEVPFGTVMILIGMFAAVAMFVGVRRFRTKNN